MVTGWTRMSTDQLALNCFVLLRLDNREIQRQQSLAPAPEVKYLHAQTGVPMGGKGTPISENNFFYFWAGEGPRNAENAPPSGLPHQHSEPRPSHFVEFAIESVSFPTFTKLQT